MRESTVEGYLVDRVKATGGFVRKQIWLGCNGAPDRFCWWPNGRHAWIELKRPGKAATGLEPHQLREINKMLRSGLDVRVIDTKKGVDEFIADMIGE